MKILFLHGWQSVPGGVKPTFLAQHGHEVINPKLPDEDFEEAVKIAQMEFDKQQFQVVVGSSGGGAVARVGLLSPVSISPLPWPLEHKTHQGWLATRPTEFGRTTTRRI
jgi:hypothetical protein